MGKGFFEKDEYTQQDLQSLIDNEVEESLWLDYKACGALDKSDGKKKEISKDVSAFANSDGGIIIYGMQESDHKPSAFSFIDGDDFSKEWLENVIDGNIQQRIIGIEIHPIRIYDDIKKSVYIVKIPSSSNAPHMCSDKKFYRRYNFKSVPMEEYEIRLLYSRVSSATVEVISMSLVDDGTEYNSNNKRVVKKKLFLNVKNISETIEKNCKLQLRFEEVELNGIDIVWDRYSNVSATISHEKSLIVSAFNLSPIFPSEEITLCTFTLRIETDFYEKFMKNAVLNFKVYHSSGYSTAEVKYSDLEKKIDLI